MQDRVHDKQREGTVYSNATLQRENGLKPLTYQALSNRPASQMSWLLWLWVLLFALPAHAQTPVSGAIAVNSHWTTADSPYLISGDVVVQNGAVLSIDSGVTVYMTANASLTVQAGGIQALGTTANPINVLSDKSRLAQDAAPGDWKQWVFNPGTSNTKLEHVLFEHGKGLVVNGCAPTLNYLNISHQLGAAITLDLAASPIGIGNQATGNTLNGISIPAGDIKTSVKWGLRGIPYVINSGTVSVGASPTITSITPNKIQQGATITIDLVGTRLIGLSNAKFDNTGLTAQIVSGATDTQASLSVTATQTAQVGNTTVRMMVDAGEINLADAITVVPTQAILSNLSPNKLYLGQGTVDITINGSNFSDKSTLQVNNAATTVQYQSATQLKASIATPTTATNLLFKVLTPDPFNEDQELISNELILPVVQGQISLSPTTLTATKGFTKTLTVTLPYPAGANGLTLDLVSSVTAVGSVPATVSIPAGQTTATFTFTATDAGTTTITASKVGFLSGQALATVVPPPTLSFTPNSLILGVGRTATVTVQSSVPAGASGLNITLSSSNTGVATVPATVTISAGNSSTTFTVTTKALGSATIIASANEYLQGNSTVTVKPVSLSLPANILVTPGLVRSIALNLSDPAPAGGLLVTLASGDSDKATVPTTITVPEGQKNASFNLSGVAQGNTSITASATGYESASMDTTVTAISIGVGNPEISSINLLPDAMKSFAISLSNPAPTGGVVVNLVVANSTIATVTPASISISEGETSNGNVLATVKGIANGSTTLTANATGLVAANVPVIVTNKPDLIVFSVNAPAAAIDPNTNGSYSFPVSYTIANTGASAAQPGWYDRIYLSSDAIWDAGDPLLAQPYQGTAVTADGAYTASPTVTTSSGIAPGNYYVIVVADYYGYLGEANEGNNVRVSWGLGSNGT
jgi:trimeric autotransporter adhesin